MKITLLAVLVVHAAIASAQTSKTDYMDVMEAAVSAYSDARLVGLTETAERDGVQEHGFPRLAANLGFLVANGRLAEKKPLLARMMTVCCRDAAKGPMPVRSSGNEFSVKELVWALVQLEAARTYEKSVTDAWRADLARIDARASYRTGRLSLGERARTQLGRLRLCERTGAAGAWTGRRRGVCRALCRRSAALV